MSSLSADVFDGGGKDKQSNKNKERGGGRYCGIVKRFPVRESVLGE